MKMDFDELVNEPLRFTVAAPERLDAFLAQMLPQHSRSKLVRSIDAGEVQVDGQVAAKSGLKLKVGSCVELNEPEEAAAHNLEPVPMDLDVVHEDDSLLVIDKPRGLAVHPAASLREPSLVNALLARGGSLSQVGGSFRPGIVHRLDKDTTGLIVIAKADAIHVALAKQFEAKTAERRYLGVVAGEPDRRRFDVDAPIGRDPTNRQRMAITPDGKDALTHCLAIRQVGPGTLMAFRLSTGRTHQIRVHLRAIGHPILGDSVYAPQSVQPCPLQLHAAYLAFEHPVTQARLCLLARPPEDLIGRDHWSPDIFDPFEVDKID